MQNRLDKGVFHQGHLRPGEPVLFEGTVHHAIVTTAGIHCRGDVGSEVHDVRVPVQVY